MPVLPCFRVFPRVPWANSPVFDTQTAGIARSAVSAEGLVAVSGGFAVSAEAFVPGFGRSAVSAMPRITVTRLFADPAEHLVRNAFIGTNMISNPLRQAAGGLKQGVSSGTQAVGDLFGRTGRGR